MRFFKKSDKLSPTKEASLLNSPSLRKQGDHLQTQSEDYVLTLAGFEALQLVKLSKTWSLWLGRASALGNTPSFHSCLDPWKFSELAATPFLCTETSLPEDGTWSRVGSGEALLHLTGWKLNINVYLLLPAWKSQSQHFNLYSGGEGRFELWSGGRPSCSPVAAIKCSLSPSSYCTMFWITSHFI